MKKTLGLIMLTGIISLSSFAQQSRDKIENQARDPKTRENAAKADRYIMDKKTISDSTEQAKNSAQGKQNTLKSSRKKKSSCKSGK